MNIVFVDFKRNLKTLQVAKAIDRKHRKIIISNIKNSSLKNIEFVNLNKSMLKRTIKRKTPSLLVTINNNQKNRDFAKNFPGILKININLNDNVKKLAKDVENALPIMPELSVINQATYDRVLHIIKKPKGKVLDLGTGSGNLSYILKKKEVNVHACDIFKEAFTVKGVPFKKADLNNKFPYSANEFDMVIGIEVIEHLENPWHLLSECQRIMKNGGTLILTTPNVNSIFGRLLYLFTGRFPHFGLDLNYHKKSGFFMDIHRTPVFIFLLKEMIFKKFFLKEISVNRSVIPFTDIKLPFTSWFWGESIIYEMVKK